MNHPTSLTIPHSVALRLRHLAGRIHKLGPRPLFELLCEVASDDRAMSRLERYAALPAGFIRSHGGDQFQSNIFVIKGNSK
jgi:hypothetical protein